MSKLKKIDMIQKVNYFVSEIKQRLTAARQKAYPSVTGTVTGTEELTQGIMLTYCKERGN